MRLRRPTGWEPTGQGHVISAPVWYLLVPGRGPLVLERTRVLAAGECLAPSGGAQTSPTGGWGEHEWVDIRAHAERELVALRAARGLDPQLPDIVFVSTPGALSPVPLEEWIEGVEAYLR